MQPRFVTLNKRCWVYRGFLHPMLRNIASGLEIGIAGRILAGLLVGNTEMPDEGGPDGRFQCFPGSSPAEIRP